MRLAIVAFASGVWLLQWQAELPSFWMLGGLAAAAACCGAFSRHFERAAGTAALAMAAFLCGFVWAGLFAQYRLADRLPPRWEGAEITLTGVVAGLPQPFDGGTRFEFDVEAADPAEAAVPARILLTWYNGLDREEYQEVVPVRSGERWRFGVRLKRPHGYANPHGFDYEAWLLERGIRATGAVRSGFAPERIDPMVNRPGYWIERLRERIREKFWDALPDHPYAGVLTALAIGDQKAIEPDDWQIFARTGVSHLMSISGLHVTMVSALFAWAVFGLWRRIAWLALRLAAQKAAALAGFGAALAYCLLTGFAVPAQRTLYMVGAVAVVLLRDRQSSSSRVLSAALLVVLLFDPWAVLSPGFWLSFGAVALIFYVGTGRPLASHWLLRWSALQWAITIGLAPALLVLFQQVSIVSPLANALAIPLVSLVVTPLALAGAVLPFEFPLTTAHWLLAQLMMLLTWLSRLEGAVWQQHAPALWTLPIALIGIAWMLLPRGFPARWLGALLILPMGALAPPSPGAGSAWLTVFDVGQGLAVLARTRDHSLLFDTGPSWGAESDSGSRIIVPALRAEGIGELDAVVVSHDDKDHAGGTRAILAAIPARSVYTSLLPGDDLIALAPYRLPCVAGRWWRWDGVSFEFLHPRSELLWDAFARANNRSCVLRIETDHGVVLITADIERRDEEQLLLSANARLGASLLVVPHHGSATSSSPAFVRAVAPGFAVMTVGYRNRFGHPREEVVSRYLELPSRVLRTDQTGALRFAFEPQGLSLRATRDTARRYWHGA